MNEGESALTIAVRNTDYGTREDRIRIINLLLENGANPNQLCHTRFYGLRELQKHNYKIPPIVAAICQDDPKLVELLIKYGADIVKPVRATQFGTYYPLDYAIKLGRKDIISILEKHGARKSP